MSRLNNRAEPEIQHISHPHPLQLSYHHPQQTPSPASCFGCKHEASGLIYTCKPCNYTLHVSCSQMPLQITHPFHQNHVLCLLPTPIYPAGLFYCNACRKPGNGFSYHCRACGIDLHILCASMPLHLTHHTHPHHQLHLTFFPPYYNKTFGCNICNNMGSNHWLYRCNLCGFDAHLDCAIASPRAPIQAPIQQHQVQQCPMVPTTTFLYQLPVATHQSITGPRPPLQSLPNNFANYATPGAYGSVTPVVSQGNSLLNLGLQGLLVGAAQTTGQIFIHGLLGVGGGSGGDGGSDSSGYGGAGAQYDFGGGVIGGDGGSFYDN